MSILDIRPTNEYWKMKTRQQKKKIALKIVDQLLSHYKSEWEGTSDFEKEYPKMLLAVKYIKQHLL